MRSIAFVVCIGLLCDCHNNAKSLTETSSANTESRSKKGVDKQTGNYFVLLKGKIDVYPVTMYLYKSSRSYGGYYYYDSKQQPISFSGEDSTLPPKIVLTIFSDNNSTETFILSFDGVTATGNWRMGSKQLNVSLSQANLPVQWDYYSLQDSAPAKVEMTDPPQAAAEMASVWPKNNSATDEFIKTRIGELFDEKQKSSDIHTILQNSTASFLLDYASDTTILPEDVKDRPGSFNYEIANDCRVVYQSQTLLSLSFSSYAYTGGAHGNYGTSYLPLDLTNNKPITLTDIINKKGVSQLRSLLEKNYRKIKNLKLTDPLTEGGLFENKIEPNDNFYVTGKGLIFSYQPYEIASYAEGEIEIMIDYIDLPDYLQPEFKKLLQ